MRKKCPECGVLLDERGIHPYKEGMKRNKLEKLIGLSKSSLAATLHQLERRKIVDIDKSGKVHYVQLSEWFKNL